MTIVEQVISESGFTDAAGAPKLTEFAAMLSKLTGVKYRKQNVRYWLDRGHFPADLADVIAGDVMGGSITKYQACPNIKRVVAAA